MEASFPLPVVDSERTFTTSSGRKIVVPAQPGLSNDDVTLVIRTEDPFMKKIEQIDSRWFIRFSSYESVIVPSRSGVGCQYGFHVLFRRV